MQISRALIEEAVVDLKGLIEVPISQYHAMIGDLEHTDVGCTVHTSPDGDWERIYCVRIRIWTNYYCWADKSIHGYQTVAAVVTRNGGKAQFKRHFVHSALIDRLTIF
jgi:hypothetical protein